MEWQTRDLPLSSWTATDINTKKETGGSEWPRHPQLENVDKEYLMVLPSEKALVQELRRSGENWGVWGERQQAAKKVPKSK